jgi:glycosyltransferase involved in cell wall biosynthesis
LSSSVALVIPAWHEEAALAAVLAEVPPATIDAVFVVVPSRDDPSADIALAHGARVLVQTSRGYGAACWEGARAAMEQGAEVIVFMDGDYSDPPGFLPMVLDPIRSGQVDFSLGCRDFARFPLALPPHARLGNALVLTVLSLILRRRVRDLPSLKAIRAEPLRQLGLREMTYGFTVEMIVKSVRAGLRIAQIPVPYRPRLGGRSKISGSVHGTIGAAWKLCTCPLRYALWRPSFAPLNQPEIAG